MFCFGGCNLFCVRACMRVCVSARALARVCVVVNLRPWQVSPPKRSAKQRYRRPIVVASVIARRA